MLDAMLKKGGKRLLAKDAKEVQRHKDINSGKALKQHIKKNPCVLKTYSDAVEKDKKMYGEDVMPPKHYGGKGVEGAKFDLYMQKRKQQNAAMKPKSVEEGIMDAVKNLAAKAGKALTGGSDKDQRKDLQRKMGVPQTGKKPMQK
jgi:hypothetical protein